MNKTKAIVVTILLSSALILFFLNGTIPRVISILLSYPNYVIVVADEYYGNPVLQQFVNHKTSQGFTVEVKKVSEIYAQYPVSNEVTEFLKVTGPVNVTRTTPFVLSDVPVGTYLLNATYDSISKTHVIVLEEGQDVSYTFEFEVYTPSLTSNILSLAFQLPSLHTHRVSCHSSS
jgi:hypothetical protein